jgi:hypothetical protein
MTSTVEQFASDLIGAWRDEAKILRVRGADAQATVLESCALELEEKARLFSHEEITLEQAAEESGYSYSALEKMARRGRIPNAGLLGHPRIRRKDLPKKPGRGAPAQGGPNLADLVLAE